MGHDILVWPEAAIPNYYQNAREFLDPIAEQAAIAETYADQRHSLSPGWQYAVSQQHFGPGRGRRGLTSNSDWFPLVNTYRWKDVMRGLIAFFDLPMSAFSPGPQNQAPLQAAGFRVAPYICYEIVYPDLVAKSARNADLLITISNDSWFGDSIGPLQHLQMAQMRALENGRYLIRGTNNGVSAIINHRGQIVAATEQFVETSLSGEVEDYAG